MIVVQESYAALSWPPCPIYSLDVVSVTPAQRSDRLAVSRHTSYQKRQRSLHIKWLKISALKPEQLPFNVQPAGEAAQPVSR